ncbi:hypothetical protein SUGI_0200590 [Cryptomeria japonica]|nr:hypothetical protein SUGI_0200590 [Cryptomeria japonica]
MSIAGLDSMMDQVISVITNDGRNIVGILRGFDQATNLILDESHERVYSTTAGVEQLVLGLYIIRGDNISVSTSSKARCSLIKVGSRCIIHLFCLQQLEADNQFMISSS